MFEYIHIFAYLLIQKITSSSLLRSYGVGYVPAITSKMNFLERKSGQFVLLSWVFHVSSLAFRVRLEVV